jgi:RimJ/RimL family protein N-acetyltransferase
MKVGTCGLYDRGGLEDIDIGYALLTKFEKRGYAFEAAEKLKTLAFTEFGLERLSAVTSKNNLVSQKLLEKLGLALTGTTKLPTSEEELFLFEIKKESLVK